MVIVHKDHDVTVSEFERIAHAVERESDSVRLEYIDGRMGVKGMPDGDHGGILNWLLTMLWPLGPALFLHVVGQGLRVDSYRKGRARPDAVVAPPKAFVGCGEWAPADQVSMAVEVTSYDSDTNQRDRIEKPAAYARTPIPIYLLIDRQKSEMVVYSAPDPDAGLYREIHRYAFGEKVPLPRPLNFELDTAAMLDWLG
ncbi:Uma2 family endonuclease [Nocardia aurantia]|uniref:Putative restriction endonuclease domain-containing protein n=1 Tax=Nocardia aurantia TaxID=2585199 RepID=A0A7K0DLB6_9NOCA|nr:Uma2 family endonuclease [Nocardia aurantia]MQY26556.1 hypothetical protein [Nocardia aurantia]